jgi:23S rRNA (uridine2552-2'-O)-methyltransferase
MTGRVKGAGRWTDEHAQDPYVQRARREGYRSRAAYKLLELQRRDQLLHRGMTVVDLGAAPGGWSQVAAKVVGERGLVVALLPMDPLPGVTVLQGDFHERMVLDQLLACLDGRPVNLVMSDMAPNMSGMSVVDQPRAVALAELAVDLATRVLASGGDLLVKIFQGSGFDELHRALRADFARVVVRKPNASRARSREVYILARGYGL